MTKTVIFVGYALEDYIEYFKRENYTIGYFYNPTDKDSLLNLEHKKDKLDFAFPLNFQSTKNLEISLKNLHLNPTSLLICLRDRYLYPTTQIAQILNLDQKKSLATGLGLNATNKIFQREVFKKKFPEITPEFRRVRTFHQAYLFTRKYGFPVIIKPANLSQSQLVNVCTDLESLIQKGSYVLDHVAEVYKENNVNRLPQVGIEQYIQGKQYSVDSYVDFDGNVTHTPICEQIIGYDLGQDNFETLYSIYSEDLTDEKKELVYQTVSKAIEAMNIKGNPTHTEVRIDDNGNCKIVEVNVRTGGYRAEMLKISYDIEHVQNVINTYLGKPVEVSLELKQYSACPQFWAPEEGVLLKINGLEEVKKLKSFYRISNLNRDVGKIVGPASLGHPKSAYLILAHKDKKILEEDIKKAREIISFEVTKLPKSEE